MEVLPPTPVPIKSVDLEAMPTPVPPPDEPEPSEEVRLAREEAKRLERKQDQLRLFKHRLHLCRQHKMRQYLYRNTDWDTDDVYYGAAVNDLGEIDHTSHDRFDVLLAEEGVEMARAAARITKWSIKQVRRLRSAQATAQAARIAELEAELAARIS